MRDNPIGVFDSGVGGLNVLSECVRLLPDERFIYIADEANMPYGEKTTDDIRRAATGVADTLFSMNCKAIVIACNTATATSAEYIRALYGTRIVVGLEPAVKPCFRELDKGYAVALVTAATFRSDKFERLINSCDGRVIPVARPELAGLIEQNMSDISKLEKHVHSILEPYRDAESIVLGCSHYTYIKGMISKYYDGGIKIYDGASGAAERLKYCLEQFGMTTENRGGAIKFFSTKPSARQI